MRREGRRSLQKRKITATLKDGKIDLKRHPDLGKEIIRLGLSGGRGEAKKKGDPPLQSKTNRDSNGRPNTDCGNILVVTIPDWVHLRSERGKDLREKKSPDRKNANNIWKF